MLSIKQGSVKYHFLSLWYDSTWDWTLIFQAIGEHSSHLANVRLMLIYIYIYIYIYVCVCVRVCVCVFINMESFLQ